MDPTVQPEKTYEDLLREDFRNFVYVLWQHLNLPDPTWVQYDIAVYLQNGPRRRMVQAFRGVGKSWLTAAYVLWRLFKNPNERILVVSASKDRADAFTTFVRRLILEVPMLQYLAPDPTKNHRDSNLAFDVGPSEAHQAPSVRSVGITGQMAGSRASIIIADDTETPKNALTVTMRDRLSEAVKEFDAVLTPDGEVIYLGTPQTIMSLYNALPARGYDVRIWPARYPKSEKSDPVGLAPAVKAKATMNPALRSDCMGRGAPTDPVRFSDLDLLEREASYGRAGFALQFMLDTSLSDENRFPLKLADLMVFPVDTSVAPVKLAWGSSPEQLLNTLPVVGLTGDRYYRPMFVHKDFVPFTGSVLAIDPSGRGKDETGYAVVKMLNGLLYVTACGGFAGGYDDATMQSLALVAKQHKVNWITIEPNFGDGMFDKLFAPWLERVGYPCTIDPDPPHSSVQKEKRIIDTLEPVMNQHLLVVDQALILKDIQTEDEEYQFFYQLTHITREKGALRRYDRLDALAMAVAYWVEQMGEDPTKREEQWREEKMQQEIDKFLEAVHGASPQASSWNNSILG